MKEFPKSSKILHAGRYYSREYVQKISEKPVEAFLRKFKKIENFVKNHVFWAKKVDFFPWRNFLNRSKFCTQVGIIVGNPYKKFQKNLWKRFWENWKKSKISSKITFFEPKNAYFLGKEFSKPSQILHTCWKNSRKPTYKISENSMEKFSRSRIGRRKKTNGPLYTCRN